MTFLDFSEYCHAIWKINQLPPLTENQISLFFELTDIMLETNKTMNLTAIRDKKSVIAKHYADSLLFADYFPKNARILDVGCGAGFPTFPLAIVRPDLTIVALDSTAKRIDYVARTANFLKLQNITAIAARAEELGHNAAYREKFNIVTARAVAPLPILGELCLPLVQPGGLFVAMKAKQTQEEIVAAQTAIETCGGAQKSVVTKDLCLLDGAAEARTLVLIKKEKPTPQNFPRHFSKISKKPL